MDMSVVVPVYGSGQFLPGLLKSLLNQDYRGEYEIIIVDDGSTDGTEDVVKGIKAKNLFYIKQENSGPASARNRGIKNSRGRIITFTDGDCIPDRRWLSEIKKSFTEGVDGVEGKVETLGKIYPDSHFIKNNSGNMFLTSNVSYLRSAVIAGFDRRYKYPNREDSDIAFRLISRGKNIIFSEKAVVRHRLLKSSLKCMLKRKLYFQSDILLFKKYPELYRGKIKFPFERFTPVYVIFVLGGFLNNLAWSGLLVSALAEIVYRKYSFSTVSFIKFLVAQAIGSFLNIFAVLRGCLRYKVNPARLL